jgi:hypothetical protein
MYVRLVSLDDGFPAFRLCVGDIGSGFPRLKHGDHYWGAVICILSYGIECGEFLLGVRDFAVDGLERIHEYASLSITWGMAIRGSGG